MIIKIENELLNIIPDFKIEAYTMDVKVRDSSIIEDAIQSYENKIIEEYSLADVLNIPLIKEARDGYKKLGKDPSRYRLACESLLRRLVKGYGLYRINNVVDVGNLLSLELFRSTAILDRDKIFGDPIIRLGNENDDYYGIGRGKINVTNIPVYEDSISPFGSPTSDTERTMITNETKTILLMIICFGKELLESERQKSIDMFKTYAYAQNINKVEVIKGELWKK